MCLLAKLAASFSSGVLGSYSMANEQGHPPVPHKQLPAADDNSYRQTKKGKSKGSSSSPGTAEEPHQSNASKAVSHVDTPPIDCVMCNSPI